MLYYHFYLALVDISLVRSKGGKKNLKTEFNTKWNSKLEFTLVNWMHGSKKPQTQMTK